LASGEQKHFARIALSMGDLALNRRQFSNLASNYPSAACRKTLNLTIPAENLAIFCRLFEKFAEKVVFFDPQ
jgi:hypothetical protein